MKGMTEIEVRGRSDEELLVDLATLATGLVQAEKDSEIFKGAHVAPILGFGVRVLTTEYLRRCGIEYDPKLMTTPPDIQDAFTWPSLGPVELIKVYMVVASMMWEDQDDPDMLMRYGIATMLANSHIKKPGPKIKINGEGVH